MTAQASHHATNDLHRGLLHHQQGELDLARRAYRRVLQRRPSDADALRLLATVEMQRGRHAEAEECARRALRAGAGEASAHNTLGQVLSAQGRFSEAREAFEQAVTLDENLANARANLGRCLLRMGQSHTGIEQMRMAAHQEPGDAALACEIAGALMQSGDIEAAEQYFLLALEWAPDAAVSYLNLGAFYIDQNKPDVATAYLSKAVELNPDEPSGWMNLSRALRMLGELAAALECLDRVLSLQPGNPDAMAFAASIVHQQGEYDEAQRLFTQVLNAHPNHVMAAQGMAELQEWTGDYEAAVHCLRPIIESTGYPPELAVTYARVLRRIDRHEQALELLEGLITGAASAASLSKPLLKQLHFTLANLYDDLGRAESAWHHVTTANSMASVRFDTASHSAMVEQIMQAAADTETGPYDPGHSDERPVFIVGMPRSGTSLVEQILASHPHVHALGESGFVGASLPDGFPQLNSVLQAADCQRFREAFEKLAKSVPDEAVRVTEKTPLNFLFLGLIQLAFPGARVIHCRRHPLDTMLSCFFTDFRAPGLSFTSDLDALASYYREYERLMEHWRGLVKLPLLEVSYEELVSDPEAQIRELITFVDLEWDDRCLEHHLCERTVHTASHAQVREPIYTRAVGRWQKYEQHLAMLREFSRD